jgi:hypothetical protein
MLNYRKFRIKGSWAESNLAFARLAGMGNVLENRPG